MLSEIYFDNSATTRVSDSVKEKIIELLDVKYGNPSSLHSKGLEAENELRRARESVATALGADSREIYFTSGGTEANNLAILGAANAKRRTGNKIVTTAIEHASVEDALRQLEAEGFEVIRLPPDSDGEISANAVADAVDENTVLVSVMMCNNETGLLPDIASIRKSVFQKNKTTLFHTDAVQSFLKIPLNVKKLGVDLLTVSAHKIHGPKGTGALYVKKGVRLTARTFGGGQENSLRPGTESTPLIAGFGQACSEADPENSFAHVAFLNTYARKLLSKNSAITVNSQNNALPHILNISILGIKSETMLHYLAAEGIYISSGSACSRGKKSRVLKNMGLSDALVDSALRISFSKYNTTDEIDVFIDRLGAGMSRLTRVNTRC